MYGLLKGLLTRILTFWWRRQVEDRLRAISLIGLCCLVCIVVAVAVAVTFLSLFIGNVPILRQRRRVQLGWRCAWTITGWRWTRDRRLLLLRLRLLSILLGLVKTSRGMVLRRLCGGCKMPVVRLVLLRAGYNRRIGQLLLFWWSIWV